MTTPPADAAASAATIPDETFSMPALIPPDLRVSFEELYLRADAVIAAEAMVSERILIDGGIIELPPAGYLPVDLNASADLPTQIQRLLGPGVELRFCTMRPDQGGFEIRKAQDLDRISLLMGIDDSSQKPKVDILVPDGEWTTAPITATAPSPPKLIIGEMAASARDLYLKKPVATTNVIKANLDWVLFRRRSDLDCGGTPPPPPAPVKVGVWDIQLTNLIEAQREDYPLDDPAKLIQQMLAGELQDTNDLVTVSQLGQVAFTADTSDLITTAAEIAGWNSLGDDSLFIGAAYRASVGIDAEGPDRVQALVTAMSLQNVSNVTTYGNLTAQAPTDGADADIYLLTAAKPVRPAPACFDLWILPSAVGQVAAGRLNTLRKAGQDVERDDLVAALGFTPDEEVRTFHVDVDTDTDVIEVPTVGGADGFPNADTMAKVSGPQLVVWTPAADVPHVEKWVEQLTHLMGLKEVNASAVKQGTIGISMVNIDFELPECPVRMWLQWGKG